jgi:hypothetical protein
LARSASCATLDKHAMGDPIGSYSRPAETWCLADFSFPIYARWVTLRFVTSGTLACLVSINESHFNVQGTIRSNLAYPLLTFFNVRFNMW